MMTHEFLAVRSHLYSTTTSIFVLLGQKVTLGPTTQTFWNVLESNTYRPHALTVAQPRVSKQIFVVTNAKVVNVIF